SSLSISTSSSPCQDADPQRSSPRLSRVDITIPKPHILYNSYLIYNLYFFIGRKSSGLDGERRSIPSRRCRPATGFCSASNCGNEAGIENDKYRTTYCPDGG